MTDTPTAAELAHFDQTHALIAQSLDVLIGAYRGEVADGNHPAISTAGLAEWLRAEFTAEATAEHLAVAVARLAEKAP